MIRTSSPQPEQLPLFLYSFGKYRLLNNIYDQVHKTLVSGEKNIKEEELLDFSVAREELLPTIHSFIHDKNQ